MVSRGYFRVGLGLNDSSDSDGGEDIRKPKHASGVTRTFDPNKSQFQRIRNRPKKTSVMSMTTVHIDMEARNRRLAMQTMKNNCSKNGVSAKINSLYTPKSSTDPKPTGSKVTPKNIRSDAFNPNKTSKRGIGVTPKRSNNSHKRKHNADNDESRDFTPKHKRRKLNAQLKTPEPGSSSKKWKNVKTPVNNNKNPRYIKLPDVKRNKNGLPISNNTPEYKKIKEDDSEKHIKIERKTRRNAIMKMRTRKGQPIMSGRIELLLEEIQRNVNMETTG